jgi:spore coat polysaccharide biosynthesis protein SpsF
MEKIKKKIIAITQARTGSTRLPNKVLMEVGGKSFLEIHLERVSKSKLIDEVIVATTDRESDSVIASLSLKLGYNVYRGSENDVLDRYYRAALVANADIIVRVTSDCPLVDPDLIDQIIQEHLSKKNDFTTNIINRTFPDGFDVEVFNFDVLRKAWKEASLLSDREHVTYYIWKNSNLLNGNIFSSFNITAEKNQNFSHIRLTLDYPEDKELLEKLIVIDGIEKSWKEYVDTLLNNPFLLNINKSVNSNL